MTESVQWVKWHFAKWRGEPTLRMCSLAARGLWMDLLAIMHECEPYGHLVVGGRKPTSRQIASMVGMATEKEVDNALAELVDYGVCSLTEAGVIYSRRMVRDKAVRENGRQTGSLGGNPALKKKDNLPLEGGLTPSVNPEKRREEKEKEKDNPPPPLKEDLVAVQTAATAWNAMAGKCGLSVVRDLTDARKSKLRQRLRECGGINAFREVIETIPLVPFLLGDNKRGWKADFDFVLQQESFTKLREGIYANRGNGAGPGQSGQAGWNDF